MSRSQQSATAAVRCGLESDSQFAAVVPPIHLSSTFAFAGFDQKRAYDYTRSANPTRDLLGEALAYFRGADRPDQHDHSSIVECLEPGAGTLAGVEAFTPNQ